jgi:hypothetical protein
VDIRKNARRRDEGRNLCHDIGILLHKGNGSRRFLPAGRPILTIKDEFLTPSWRGAITCGRWSTNTYVITRQKLPFYSQPRGDGLSCRYGTWRVNSCTLLCHSHMGLNSQLSTYSSTRFRCANAVHSSRRTTLAQEMLQPVIEIAVFWDMTQCRMEYQKGFGGTCTLRLQQTCCVLCKWGQWVPQKRLYPFTELHGFMPQNTFLTGVFTITKTSDLISAFNSQFHWSFIFHTVDQTTFEYEFENINCIQFVARCRHI